MTKNEPMFSPNVYGIETEYSCMITLPGQVVHEIVGSCHSQDTKLDLYVQPAERGTKQLTDTMLDEALKNDDILRNCRGMLSNGARFYMDPSGPEYATAETRTAEEAVLRSFDGDSIVLRMFHSLRKAGIVEGFQFNRRIVDHNRTSRGIHINTATYLDSHPDTRVTQHLAALNVAKGAMFGSGGLLLNENGHTQFHHSPRLSLTNNLSADYSSYTQRPLVRKPFKQDGDLNRIETVTSDALTFAWPMKASLVITNALVKLLELGVDDLPTLRRPLRAANVVGRHGNTNLISVELADGTCKSVRPVEILREISERALKLDLELEFLDQESDQVLEEIIQTADDITRDYTSAAGRVESIARQIAIKSKMEKDSVSIDSEKICKFDYYWDLIGDGLAQRIRDKGVSWHGFSDTTTGHKSLSRQHNPPKDTRAFLRSIHIRSNPSEDRSSWSDIDTGEKVDYVHPVKLD
jgi:hypothetical protein